MEILEMLFLLLCGMSITLVFSICERIVSQPYRETQETLAPEGSLTRESPSTATRRRPFVVRVSGIPVADDYDVISLVNITISARADHGSYRISNISIVPSCTDPDSLVALVDFTILPKFLQPLRGGLTKSCEIPGRGGHVLSFDANFLGFTQMYTTKIDPAADIVLIPGIGSHAYGSWTSRSEPWQAWPRHFLPNRFPHARVMIYGHKADIRGIGFGVLLDHSRSLGEALEVVRKQAPNRPIVFIAHSFGGNILKTFLVKNQQTGGLILKAARGMMFFAVPHRGMDVEDMIAAIKHHNTSETILHQINEQEAYWRQELDSFIDIVKGCKVASFYETALTQRLLMKPNGSFAREGRHIAALKMHSAVLDLPSNVETKHPVDADHSAIVKFENATSQAFTQVLNCLESFLASDQKQLRYTASINATSKTNKLGHKSRAFRRDRHGTQFNNTGSGGQYNNTGSGSQYNTW